jgi:hypothetical protein
LHLKKSIIWLFCDLGFKRVSIADIGDKIYDDENIHKSKFETENLAGCFHKIIDKEVV